MRMTFVALAVAAGVAVAASTAPAQISGAGDLTGAKVYVGANKKSTGRVVGTYIKGNYVVGYVIALRRGGLAFLFGVVRKKGIPAENARVLQDPRGRKVLVVG
jgi:hypothetical protein